MTKMITAEQLRHLLRYCKSTGLFWWREPGPKRRLSLPAGTGGAGQYRRIMIDGVNYHGHRLAWLYVMGEWPAFEVDHRNRIKGDDRWRNLRPATHKQNGENTRTQARSVSGVKGVYFDPRRQNWQAYITHHRQRRHLGCFSTKGKATATRRAAEKLFFTHAP